MADPNQAQRVGEAKHVHRAWSLYLFKIAGIPVYVHFTFLIMLILIGLIQPGGKPVFVGGVPFVLLIFGSVLLHEFGHALVARHYGIRTDDIVLYPIGGVARMRSLGEGFQEFWIAIAGPAVNVVIAAGLFVLLRLTGKWVSLAIIAGHKGAPAPPDLPMLQNLFFVNIFLILFNLIPAFPMDGGRILRAILVRFYSKEKATAIAAKIGQGLAIVFMMAGFINSEVFLMVIGLFVFLAAGQEFAATRSAALMAGHLARDAMITHFDILHHGDTLGRAADLLLATSQQEFPVMNGTQVLGVLGRKSLVQGLATHGRDHYVAEVMDREYPRMRPGDDLQTAYEMMAADGGLPVLIFDHERLLGYINRENLMEYLLIAQTAQNNH